MAQTVIEYVLKRLKDLGIKDVFGIPGDYSFQVNDAICNDKAMRWIGCCNELNAAYAADGYARMRGLSCLCTTYGVGELSALCGVAGAYSEHLPVVHLVGMPQIKTQRERRIVHHTLGNGEFDLYARMTEPVVCASAILTPDNAACETERVIHALLTHRRPVYLAVPGDYAEMPLPAPPLGPSPLPQSDPEALAAVVEAIVEKLDKAKTAVVLAGYLIPRLGLCAAARKLVEALGLPFATMFMDKTALDETMPGYIGIYDGRIMNPEVREFVEGCDCVLNVGALWSDFNTGAYTANIDCSRMITVAHHTVRVGRAIYPNVEMADVLAALPGKVANWSVPAPVAHGLGVLKGGPNDAIAPDYLYPRWEKMLRPGDILVAETGTVSMGLGFARMPEGSVFLNQTLWGSIGWATPAAFGAGMAAPGQRLLLVTGEGSHQMTAQEVGQFCRYGLKPIIFCLNNDGYLIERLLCKDPMIYYNDIARWNYAKLPAALGCDDWYAAKVTTNAELDAAITKAESCGTGAYIEVVMDKMAGSPLAMKLHESLQTLYG